MELHIEQIFPLQARSNSAHQCCCKHQTISSQAPKSKPPEEDTSDTPSESCSSEKQACFSGTHHVEPLAMNHFKSQSFEPLRKGNAWESSQDPETGVSKRLDELLEGANTPEEASARDQSAETRSIDLRTPEKQPRSFDLSLGAMSPAYPGKPNPEDPSKRKG